MSIKLKIDIVRLCLFGALLLSFVSQVIAQPTPVKMKERLTLRGHGDYPLSLAFSPDGLKLASAGFRQVILWDVASGQILHTLEEGDSVAFSPDGHTLALGNYGLNGGNVLLWDADNWKLIETPHCQLPNISLAFSPDGGILASGGWESGNVDTSHKNQVFGGELKLWDVANRKLLRTLQDPGPHTLNEINNDYVAVESVSFSPDGRTLASKYMDGSIRLRDVASGNVIHTLEAGDRSVPAFDPDGRILVSGGKKGHNILLWDVASGRLLRTLQGHKDSVLSLAFSPDGRVLASVGWEGEDSTAKKDETAVKLWDVARGTRLYTQQVNVNSVILAAFSPDDHILATSSQGEGWVIKLWHVTGLHK